jgi:hypothetical protein
LSPTHLRIQVRGFGKVLGGESSVGLGFESSSLRRGGVDINRCPPRSTSSVRLTSAMLVVAFDSESSKLRERKSSLARGSILS